MTQAADEAGFQTFDSNAVEWDQLYIEQLGRGVPVKAFTSDPDTGMSCQLIK